MNSPRGCIGPVNIGNDTETTLQELAVKIIALTNAESKIIYKPLPEDDPKRRKPDMALARKELNYVAKVSLEEGLRKTVDYFKTVVS